MTAVTRDEINGSRSAIFWFIGNSGDDHCINHRIGSFMDIALLFVLDFLIIPFLNKTEILGIRDHSGVVQILLWMLLIYRICRLKLHAQKKCL